MTLNGNRTERLTQSILVFCIFASVGLPVFAVESEVTEEAGAAYFETEIRPLFAKHCYQCHSERASEQEGGLLLDRRTGWMEGGDSGPSVTPHNPDASLLIRAVRYVEADLEMPPVARLPEPDVVRLEQWVRMGAPGPLNNQVVDVDNPSDPVAGKSHWAFQPIAGITPPQVSDPTWPRGAIDRFVLAGLDNAGLKPVEDADSRVLKRRLSFALHGLPPISDFADLATESMSRYVDRLLADPRYGERWGRHWLDLARYADSNGLDENFLFREAWRYRNWVIDATNEDLAFDQFLTMQIAGDLLPYDSIEQRDDQRIASGFLVIGPKVLLGIEAGQQRMDVADEQIDTIGRAVLAQTLGCARCHDHKFDPIPTADYYALAGIFTSTRVMEKRHMLSQQRVMEQLVGLGADGKKLDDAYEKFWREQSELKSRKQHAEKALSLLQDSDAEALAKHIKDHRDAVSPVAIDPANNIEIRIADQEAFLATIKETLANPPKIPPRAMSPVDVDEPTNEAVRLMGQFNDLGDVVPRGFLTVLDDGFGSSIRSDRSGRLELAEWLTARDSPAAHLTARVMANRIWQRLMGRGLVRTVDNFGRTGETPTHPELLDYLASELIQSGWSVKSLVRQIVTSHTFALSSHFDEHNAASDPENEYLWRANRRRLEPEMIRDAMHVAAGRLDNSRYLSTVDYLGDQATAVGANKVRRRTDFPCRSVYLPVIRNDLPEIFEAFDFANPHTTMGDRPKTIVPSQGLFMMNDEMVMDLAQATAQQISNACPTSDTIAQMDLMFTKIVGDEPSESERASVTAFLLSIDAEDAADQSHDANQRALALACQALFASSRFQIIE